MKLIKCTKEIAVRGRNGYFDLKEVEVSELGSGNFYIGLFSRKRGLSAPVSFYGSREDLCRIFAEICYFLRPNLDEKSKLVQHLMAMNPCNRPD